MGIRGLGVRDKWISMVFCQNIYDTHYLEHKGNRELAVLNYTPCFNYLLYNTCPVRDG